LLENYILIRIISVPPCFSVIILTSIVYPDVTVATVPGTAPTTVPGTPKTTSAKSLYSVSNCKHSSVIYF
jgi:hypothetical protein